MRVGRKQSKLSRLCEQDKAVRMQEDKLQQLHREKVGAGKPGRGLRVPPPGEQSTGELSVAAHAGDGAAVGQSGAERAERFQRRRRAEPDPAEGRPTERPAEHLQGALQSQRGEFHLPRPRACTPAERPAPTKHQLQEGSIKT